MHAFTHAREHAVRTAELAAEAAAWHLAHRSAAPAAGSPPALPALRNRLGEALVSAGIRLMESAHIHARVRRHAV
ncbi:MULTISPECIES: hypothetical protein [unclassified Streptomyces]|uniref:hypothetical protein n=1 Tax=unclassified Streptomyces TaxID=2593676 RepID=UPI000DC76A68|nr:MULTISPECIES: hypothetical protein [unclassified Streptomyces]AWZ05135.1 hypothetical protein DRB89_11250 [Streptomyces sp. ICC4]AWZ12628.1 hypothetical protein DRB96_10175 [Streptomyces sp. ICC1]